MFTWIKTFFSNIRGQDEVGVKLHILSILLLICFDIFLVFQITSGLDNQGNIAIRPDSRIPYECSDAYNSLKNSENKTLSLLQTLRSYSVDIHQKALFPPCNDIFSAIEKLKISAAEILIALQNKENAVNAKQNDIANFENQYQQFLHERQSGITDKNQMISSLPENIRTDYLHLEGELNSLQKSLNLEQQKFMSLADTQAVFRLVDTHFQEVQKEKEKLEYWYPVKLTGYQAILIFPLLIIALWLYRSSLKRNRLILKSLAAHIAAIVGFYAFWIIIKAVYWILPKRLLAEVYKWLENNGLLVIWNYVFIAFGILLFGVLIFVTQRFIEKRRIELERQKKEEIEKNLKGIRTKRALDMKCPQCETDITVSQKFCLVCGEELLVACKYCKHPFSPVFDYCDQCGKKQN